ncbi:MAG: transcription-repair coupling factor, partial [Candidatus Cloacimonadota bacterium]
DTEFVLLPILEACNGKETHSIMDYISGQALFIFPEFLFLDEVYENLPDIRHRNQIIISNDGVDSGIQKPMDFHGNLQLFKEHLTKIQEHRVYICCESDEERKRCEYLLEDEFPSLRFETLNIGEGLAAQAWNLFVFTDKEIFGKGFHPKRIEKSEITFKPENLSELKPGDFVVHEDYGIGIFQKMEKIEHKGQLTECLMIEFEGGDVLYVPIGAMARVSKYRGLIKGTPKLSNLSSMRWEKKKRSAKKAIEDMTKDLLKLYAERELLKGFRFSQDTVWQNELEARFQYEETEDQLRAIQDIKNDMESDRPMDRLVCGEVGYGKTEVAIRASFKAVMDSKQVLFLAPTTVLCEQHYQTFTERLRHFPINISMLSRFVSKREQKQIIDDTKTGKVDIVIGTHTLLSDKISFHDPGLLIIDEEHRFGVAQKEKLKNTRKKMDVLSMSATPIPRTLQFSLLNIRDFSIIQTPPKGRLSVITRIIRWNSGFIREIILAEIRRGGQVFFVHNRIEELNSVAARIERIVPEANITVTHGRMKSILIEKRMLDFLSGKKNVLLTTSIIESGIDISNANTIIIDRSDLFGLAQLHQLRGRVGRSNRRAYCYLIVPARISREARKRLSTIYTHSHLGSGFALALKDLEIRGAGNLLGHKQHGHIASIGYDLFMKLLQETIRELKGEGGKEKEIPEVYSDLPAFLPTSYVEDEISRIDIYRRLSAACKSQTVHTLEEDLNDRFGTPPQETKTLLLLSLTKIICSGKGIQKVSVHKDYVELSFLKARFPTKRNIESLLKNVHKKYFIDYSEGYFRIGFNIQLKKIIADLKKALQFFP